MLTVVAEAGGFDFGFSMMTFLKKILYLAIKGNYSYLPRVFGKVK